MEKLMNLENFGWWFHGYCEINGDIPNGEQWDMIKKHLDSCFVKNPVIHDNLGCLVSQQSYCIGSFNEQQEKEFDEAKLKDGKFITYTC